MKKRFVCLLLSLVCVLMFTGCSSEELSLISALQKDASMTSVKTTEYLAGNLKITLPEEIREAMDVNLQSILNMLSSFRLEATTQQQVKGNSAVAKYDYAVISDDINFSSEIYVSTENNQAKTIIKIPTPLKALLPHAYENATYCTIDTEEMTELTKKRQELSQLSMEYYGYEGNEVFPVSAITSENTIPNALKLNNNIFEFFKNYGSLMSDTPQLVTKSKNTYSFVMTDKDFKDFLHSAVITYFDKPEARDEIATLRNEIKTYCTSLYPKEMMDSFPELPSLPDDPTAISNLKLQAEVILALLNDIRIIGEDGIRIDFTTNSVGYITEIDANIHLDFDINAITELLSGFAYYEEDFAFEIRLTYQQKRQNINGIQKIPAPTVTCDNNFPLYQFLTELAQEEIDDFKNMAENSEEEFYEDSLLLPAPDGSISIVFDYDDWQDVMYFEDPASVINENGTLYVPLEPLMNWFDIKYIWNNETDHIEFQHPYTGEWVRYRPGDNIIYGDNYSITLSAPTMVKNGRDYMPLRAYISAFTEYRIHWNAEKNAAYLTPWYYFG